MKASTWAPRVLGSAAISAAVLVGAPGVAGATPSQQSLEAQAQQISAQIQAEGRQLDKYAEEYNGAQLRLQQLTAQENQLSLTMAATNRSVDQARNALKEQAVLAYLAGGGPFIGYVPSKSNTDPSIKLAYAEIVTGVQRQVVDTYRAALGRQATEAGQLAGDRRQAAITLQDVRSDQAAAQATLASERRALAQVKGQLAVLVAQAEAARQKAEEAAVRATLAAQQHSVPAAAPVTRAPDPTPVVTHPPGATTTTTVPTPPAVAPPAGNSPAPGSDVAIAYARAQLGKPYQWGGAGPNSFDCSGLVMMAWEQAGVYFPHLAQDQYDMTARVAIANLLPGDLVFYGTPSDVYHVGLYIGNGNMIDAPATGQDVSIQSIYWDGLLGGGRVSS